VEISAREIFPSPAYSKCRSGDEERLESNIVSLGCTTYEIQSAGNTKFKKLEEEEEEDPDIAQLISTKLHRTQPTCTDLREKKKDKKTL
jgi:hypothetical protein